ncbi:MAG: hypothetical protein Q8P22_08000 [Chloroflexota bacterium]|nr:hypothetical protein [Chloroflexota bacterium]
MGRRVVTFLMVVLLMALGSAAVAGAYGQGKAAKRAADRDGSPPWLGPVQALEQTAGKAFTTSAPGRLGTAVDPLSISSAANLEPGDTIKVCVDGPPCAKAVFRVIRSISGADLVLNAPVAIAVPASPVIEALDQANAR